MAKISLKYKNGNIPDNLEEILSNADEHDLRILVALMMSADESGTVSEEISLGDMLGLEKPEIDASLKFWRGAGIIGTQRAVKVVSETKKNADRADISSAHRGGAVEKSGGVSSYTTDELATLLEKRRGLSQFIDEAQRVAGMTFNSYDTGIIVGLIDQLGFEEEAILHILAYMTTIGKRGARKAEKIAINFYDDGITTSSGVAERIAIIERSSETVYKIKQLFGIGSRELSKTEKALFDKWTQKFAYDIDVIRMAYDITVDRTQKALVKYADSILTNWHTEGLRTVEQINAYEQSKRQGANAEDTTKSYDLDDFFEAALRRSLEDMD